MTYSRNGAFATGRYLGSLRPVASAQNNFPLQRVMPRSQRGTGIAKKTVPEGLVLIFLFFFSAGYSPVYASASVQILSHSGYLDLVGFYHVVGEVRNSGNEDVFADITASFYDSNNSFVSNSTSPTLTNVLLAGRTAPFDVTLCESADPSCFQHSSLVNHYSLSTVFRPYSGFFRLGLDIVSNSSLGLPDPAGWRHITGSVRNTAQTTASSVKVVATYYNSSGVVIATTFGASDPNNIGPGQQAQFDLKLSPDRSPYATTFSLTADSSEYGILSKHPYNSLLVLSPPSARVGVQTSLTATLRDDNRIPISAALIYFSVYVSGNWKDLGSASTNTAGQASVAYLPTSTGRFHVKVTYQGSTEHSPASDTQDLLVEEKSSNAPPFDTGSLISALRLIYLLPLGIGGVFVLYLLSKKIGGGARRSYR